MKFNTNSRNRHNQRWTDDFIGIPNVPESRFHTCLCTCNYLSISTKAEIVQRRHINKKSLNACEKRKFDNISTNWNKE